MSTYYMQLSAVVFTAIILFVCAPLILSKIVDLTRYIYRIIKYGKNARICVYEKGVDYHNSVMGDDRFVHIIRRGQNLTNEWSETYCLIHPCDAKKLLDSRFYLYEVKRLFGEDIARCEEYELKRKQKKKEGKMNSSFLLIVAVTFGFAGGLYVGAGLGLAECYEIKVEKDDVKGKTVYKE